jgi:hypothetical protein
MEKPTLIMTLPVVREGHHHYVLNPDNTSNIYPGEVFWDAQSHKAHRLYRIAEKDINNYCVDPKEDVRVNSDYAIPIIATNDVIQNVPRLPKVFTDYLEKHPDTTEVDIVFERVHGHQFVPAIKDNIIRVGEDKYQKKLYTREEVLELRKEAFNQALECHTNPISAMDFDIKEYLRDF